MDEPAEWLQEAEPLFVGHGRYLVYFRRVEGAGLWDLPERFALARQGERHQGCVSGEGGAHQAHVYS